MVFLCSVLICSCAYVQARKSQNTANNFYTKKYSYPHLNNPNTRTFSVHRHSPFLHTPMKKTNSIPNSKDNNIELFSSSSTNLQMQHQKDQYTSNLKPSSVGNDSDNIVTTASEYTIAPNVS